MRELSSIEMESLLGGTRTTNNCSNVGNAIATAGMILGGLSLALGPVGWIAVASFAVGYGGVLACQLGYA
ncbi:hypothetical protein [Lunatimonas salinarum]|uniref:hypothetical protein n=1 Tax=Lunatimonas salinarum TaxID=1774590 RepID=UPI001AE03093|nr:hypothetical protein [Lunatimonas salinarum]